MGVAKGRVVHTAKLSLSLLYLRACVCACVSGEGGLHACVHATIIPLDLALQHLK